MIVMEIVLGMLGYCLGLVKIGFKWVKTSMDLWERGRDIESQYPLMVPLLQWVL